MVVLIISIQILKTSYKLKSFKKESDSIIDFKVDLEIKEYLFLLSYSIFGDISEIIIPYIENFTSNYQRKDELWKTTCFELFIANKIDKSYFEINVSPDYGYNTYSFNDYRYGMKEEGSLSIKNIEKIKDNNKFNLKFILKSENLINIDNLLVNISSVIKYNNGKTEHWALNHSADKADFHDFNYFHDFTKKKH